MKVLLLSLIPIGIFLLGLLAGRVTRPVLDDKDQKELTWLRQMREDLQSQAAEHVALGDTFATIALDMMKKPPS
jgi:hypothetical protein